MHSIKTSWQTGRKQQLRTSRAAATDLAGVEQIRAMGCPQVEDVAGDDAPQHLLHAFPPVLNAVQLPAHQDAAAQSREATN